MARYILVRLGSGVALLFGVSFVAYLFLYLGSGNVARKILGINATQEDVARLSENLGLNRPFFEQFFSWLASAMQFDLGESWTRPLPVAQIIQDRLSVTLMLVVLTTIISGIVAVLLGVLAAVKGGAIDRIVQFLGLIGFAVPSFLIAMLLVSVFAIQIPIFSAVGYVQPDDDFEGFLRSVTLPVIALSLSAIAAVSGQIRGSVKDAMDSDYVRTLRSRGLGFSRVVLKHILRNAGGPALSVLGLQFVGMLGGAVIIEQIFAIPGLGPFTVLATSTSDIPAIMGLVVVTAVIVVIVNLIIDLLAAALNPKIRIS